MSVIQKLVIASHNKGKIRELTTMLTPLGIEIIPADDLNLTDVEETGETFAENAILKAETIAKQTNLPALADDSGICVDALDGLPGVQTARYSRSYEKLLKEMEGVELHKRTASFECVIALSIPGQTTEIFEGSMKGFILTEPRGAHGFGYDPVFLPEGETLSTAEMLPETKNAISHRGRALRKLLAHLKSNN